MKLLDKIIDFFLNLIFLSLLQMFGTPGMTFVRGRVGEAFKPECMVPTVKHGDGIIMVWGCMTDSGVSQ